MLEKHPLSVIHDFVLNIFVDTLHIWKPLLPFQQMLLTLIRCCEVLWHACKKKLDFPLKLRCHCWQACREKLGMVHALNVVCHGGRKRLVGYQQRTAHKLGARSVAATHRNVWRLSWAVSWSCTHLFLQHSVGPCYKFKAQIRQQVADSNAIERVDWSICDSLFI